jgi:hypothetical protein
MISSSLSTGSSSAEGLVSVANLLAVMHLCSVCAVVAMWGNSGLSGAILSFWVDRVGILRGQNVELSFL